MTVVVYELLLPKKETKTIFRCLLSFLFCFVLFLLLINMVSQSVSRPLNSTERRYNRVTNSSIYIYILYILYNDDLKDINFVILCVKIIPSTYILYIYNIKGRLCFFFLQFFQVSKYLFWSILLLLFILIISSFCFTKLCVFFLSILFHKLFHHYIMIYIYQCMHVIMLAN